MENFKNIDALILAGGKSTRMNFLDKALLKYDKNTTFLEKISNELNEFENLMVSINKNQNFLVPRGDIVTDSIDNAGPIEGIYQGLLNCKSDFIFVTTCDMPNITKEFINFLLQFKSHDYDAVIIKDSKGKTYPLFGIYSKSSLSTIEGFIMDKNYRLQDVLSELNVLYISLKNTTFDCAKLLKSIDTEQELKFNSIFTTHKPFVAICGAKNSGKTLLIEELIKHFNEAGLKAATIKFDSEYNLNNLDEEVNRYVKAGAKGSLVLSKNNYILLKDKVHDNFFQFLDFFKDFDIVLLEDFKHEPFPKIEILKESISLTPSCNPTNLLFYVSDSKNILEDKSIRSINLKDTVSIFKEILKVTNL
ncbi:MULTISPECIES: molybdopterin-guanine dinucleotide biosynthesis protein B [Cetobacterium]|uniref:Probable molybdenum cofactor guanylyltransferase n=1 Tax=Candidatus Cetobacterium colombiensis TaxID=3073100 RepID=A0ABU4W973_9FUSO|nr:molybdopterin-guanine dinucleotide biosynthesis protein B [Candidatus Cetobacterium colombiensis]MDX8336072.1 molybdopterin-guanine dinucleotide biosynthesis protein B [Candidatus Cetobacterium colombiensis]